MPLSDRTKRLLEWWQLRIQKSREETKENDESNNPPPAVNTSDSMGNSNKEEGQ
jgi:hypothetical protein